MERSLKKELSNAEEYVPALLNIAKQRSYPALQKHPSSLSKPRSNDPDPFLQSGNKPRGVKLALKVPQQSCPEGLDAAIWGTFLQWFDSKVTLENVIAEAHAEHADLKRWTDVIAFEESEYVLFACISYL